jgi:hypothetical protein
MMMRTLGLVLSLTLIAACTTPYQQMGVTGGVEDVQLNNDTYRIRARGNTYTDRTRVEDFVLLRSAEIALRRGYPYFVIVQETDQSRIRTVTVPGTTRTTTFGSVSGERFGTSIHEELTGPVSSSVGSVTTEGTTTTTVTPPETRVRENPGVEAIVQLLMSRENVAGLVYDAQAVSTSLGPRLKSTTAQ